MLKYKLITPDRIVSEGETSSLTVMTESGEITILPGHIPLATLLRAGEMRVGSGAKEELLAVSGGMLEVKPGNEIVILAETAEHSHELELAAIEEAKKRAEDALKEARNRNDVGYADAAAHLERELARYRVAMKGKGRQPKGRV
ncbi:MAG: ATP synthase F1 subunit epsilon [Patescibacteria group bacterium]|jgi:F-type H+-transporting ATPase subunit epsilon